MPCCIALCVCAFAASDVGQNTWELWKITTGGGWFHPVHMHMVGGRLIAGTWVLQCHCPFARGQCIASGFKCNDVKSTKSTCTWWVWAGQCCGGKEYLGEGGGEGQSICVTICRRETA
jgi:hypothetical protein